MEIESLFWALRLISTWKVSFSWVWLFLNSLIAEVYSVKTNLKWDSISSQLLKEDKICFESNRFTADLQLPNKKLLPIEAFIVFLFYIVN